METRRSEPDIYERSLTVLTCVKSIQFISKDLAEMETTASQETDGYYCGLTNIIELMADRIESEVIGILELVE